METTVKEKLFRVKVMFMNRTDALPDKLIKRIKTIAHSNGSYTLNRSNGKEISLFGTLPETTVSWFKTNKPNLISIYKELS
jgi:hypothetical protein